MFGCPEPSKKVWLSIFFSEAFEPLRISNFFCSVKVKVLWESYKCFEKKEQIHSDKKFDLVRLEVNLRGFGFCSTIASLHTDVKMKHLCKMLNLWACKISHTLSSWPFSFWFWSATIDVFDPLITTTLVSELASVKCHCKQYNNHTFWLTENKKAYKLEVDYPIEITPIGDTLFPDQTRTGMRSNWSSQFFCIGGTGSCYF